MYVRELLCCKKQIGCAANLYLLWLMLQRLAEEVRGELAASRAAAAAAQQDAARHATGAAADATAAAQRAVNAEADLAKARAELLRVQQDAKVCQG